MMLFTRYCQYANASCVCPVALVAVTEEPPEAV